LRPLSFSLDRFLGHRAYTINRRVGDQLPRQMIFDVIGDLITNVRQRKQLVLDDRIVGLLGKFPIHGRLAP
jgi:hypothetical protein